MFAKLFLPIWVPPVLFLSLVRGLLNATVGVLHLEANAYISSTSITGSFLDSTLSLKRTKATKVKTPKSLYLQAFWRLMLFTAFIPTQSWMVAYS